MYFSWNTVIPTFPWVNRDLYFTSGSMQPSFRQIINATIVYPHAALLNFVKLFEDKFDRVAEQYKWWCINFCQLKSYHKNPWRAWTIIVSLPETYENRKFSHTWYLSREPREFSCKFFLAGVNFYRFNAKNCQFTVYFAIIMQKFGNLLCILS